MLSCQNIKEVGHQFQCYYKQQPKRTSIALAKMRTKAKSIGMLSKALGPNSKKRRASLNKSATPIGATLRCKFEAGVSECVFAQDLTNTSIIFVWDSYLFLKVDFS